MALYFHASLSACDDADFAKTFKQELMSIDTEQLPLQQGLQHSSYVNTDNLACTVLNVQREPDRILVKAGLFYSGIIAGCSCADDPTPVDEVNEYCDVLITIDRTSAAAEVSLIT